MYRHINIRPELINRILQYLTKSFNLNVFLFWCLKSRKLRKTNQTIPFSFSFDNIHGIASILKCHTVLQGWAGLQKLHKQSSIHTSFMPVLSCKTNLSFLCACWLLSGVKIPWRLKTCTHSTTDQATKKFFIPKTNNIYCRWGNLHLSWNQEIG